MVFQTATLFSFNSIHPIEKQKISYVYLALTSNGRCLIMKFRSMIHGMPDTNNACPFIYWPSLFENKSLIHNIDYTDNTWVHYYSTPYKIVCHFKWDGCHCYWYKLCLTALIQLAIFCVWKVNNNTVRMHHRSPELHLKIKTVFPRYWDSHVKDKTVGETVLSLTWESLYW